MPGKSHGPRSQVGHSPRGRKESDTTERRHFTSWCKYFQHGLFPSYRPNISERRVGRRCVHLLQHRPDFPQLVMPQTKFIISAPILVNSASLTSTSRLETWVGLSGIGGALQLSPAFPSAFAGAAASDYTVSGLHSRKASSSLSSNMESVDESSLLDPPVGSSHFFLCNHAKYFFFKQKQSKVGTLKANPDFSTWVKKEELHL